jgi:phosphate:Na+ symporter
VVIELQMNQEIVLYCFVFFLLGILFLSFAIYLKKIIIKKNKKIDHGSDFHLKSIDNRVLNTPPLAIGQARTETYRMASLALQCLDETLILLDDSDIGRVSELQKREEVLDRLQKEIMAFLAALSLKSISHETSLEIVSLMHMINYIERIGDRCENLWRLEVRKHNQKIVYSDGAAGELKEIAALTREFLSCVVECIGQGDKNNFSLDAMKMDSRINDLESSLRHNHINRLSTGECTVLAGLIFIDMLYAFKLICENTYDLQDVIAGEK